MSFSDRHRRQKANFPFEDFLSSAYRRGLATNLKRLGIPDMVIEAILCHTDVGTTQRFYIKTVWKDVEDAMKQLERKIYGAAVAQQPEPTGLINLTK